MPRFQKKSNRVPSRYRVSNIRPAKRQSAAHAARGTGAGQIRDRFSQTAANHLIKMTKSLCPAVLPGRPMLPFAEQIRRPPPAGHRAGDRYRTCGHGTSLQQVKRFRYRHRLNPQSVLPQGTNACPFSSKNQRPRQRPFTASVIRSASAKPQHQLFGPVQNSMVHQFPDAKRCCRTGLRQPSAKGRPAAFAISMMAVS